MARKSTSQSVDQVPLPFDDLLEFNAGMSDGWDIAEAAPPKPRKKPREKRAAPALKTEAELKQTAPLGVSETPTPYEPAMVSGTVTWEIIQCCAADVLPVWNDGSELEWAEGAWNILAQGRLTSYSHAVEYHQVILRFFALCSLYIDFCRIVWDRGQEIPYSEWAAYFQLSGLRVGQLLGSETGWENGSLGANLLERALRSLTAVEQPWVIKILRRSFGGASALFDSLWATQRPPGSMTSAPKKKDPDARRHPDRIPSLMELNEDGDSTGELVDEDFRDEPDLDFIEADFAEEDISAEKQRTLEWLHTGRR